MPRYLGIDMGAEAVKVSELLGASGDWQPGRRILREHHKDPAGCLRAILESLDWDTVQGATVTGRLGRQVGLARVPLRQALGTGVRLAHGDRPITVVSIGSRGFSVLELQEGGREGFRENGRCAQAAARDGAFRATRRRNGVDALSCWREKLSARGWKLFGISTDSTGGVLIAAPWKVEYASGWARPSRPPGDHPTYRRLGAAGRLSGRRLPSLARAPQAAGHKVELATAIPETALPDYPCAIFGRTRHAGPATSKTGVRRNDFGLITTFGLILGSLGGRVVIRSLVGVGWYCDHGGDALLFSRVCRPWRFTRSARDPGYLAGSACETYFA